MANSILNDIISTKQSFQFQEIADELLMRLEKISALIEILSMVDLDQCDRLIHHHYLWALSDSVGETQDLVSQIKLDG